MHRVTKRYLKKKWPGDHRMHELIDYIDPSYYWLYSEYLNGESAEGELKWKRNVIDPDIRMVNALGHGHELYGNLSTILGGYGSIARSYRETILGSYPEDLAGTSDSWITTDRLLAVGNGIDSDNRNDALRIYKSGYTVLDNSLRIGNFSWGANNPGDGSLRYTTENRFEGWFNEQWNPFLNEETDPVFSAHVASGITSTDLSNWDAAYGWGDHADAGYLTSYTETDPVFTAHTSNNISDGSGFLKNDGSGNWSYDNSTYLSDATSDGNIYGRKNGAWVAIPSCNWTTGAYGIYYNSGNVVVGSTDTASGWKYNIFSDSHTLYLQSGSTASNTFIRTYSDTTVKHEFYSDGKVRFYNYGGGNFTGTPTKLLAVDVNGNIIEVDSQGGGGIESITGTGSITHTGTTNVTLSLVNDETSPGVNKYYGTDGTGSKGWYNLPSGGSSLWNDSDPDGIYYNSGSVSIGTTAVSGTYLLRLQKDIPGGWAAWFDNGSTSGNGVLIQGGNGADEYALKVDQESGSSNLFNVLGNGKLQLAKYGSGTFTGTPSKWLAVDSNGNLIEQNPPGGSSVWASGTYGINYNGTVGIGTTADQYIPLTVTGSNGGYMAKLYNNQEMGAGLYIEAGRYNSVLSSLIVRNDTPTTLFNVKASGAIYMPEISSQTTSTVLYYNSSNGLITYGSIESGSTYTAGTGIDITSDEISLDITEDISFEFADLTGNAQTYVIDLDATFNYTITGIVLEADDSVSFNFKVNTTSFKTGTVSTKTSYSVNTSVSATNKITMEISSGHSATVIRGKLRIARS